MRWEDIGLCDECLRGERWCCGCVDGDAWDTGGWDWDLEG